MACASVSQLLQSFLKQERLVVYRLQHSVGQILSYWLLACGCSLLDERMMKRFVKVSLSFVVF
jgi:hypothetical protein